MKWVWICRFVGVFWALGFLGKAATAQVRETTSPDCAVPVHLEPVFSQFFETFVWQNQDRISKDLKDALLYWTQFQGVLTNKYGHLDSPPAELILRNQLCHYLSKRNLRSIYAKDAELITWFQKNGNKVVDQIKNKSLELKKNLMLSVEQTRLSQQEALGLTEYLKSVKEKVMVEHF
jgi:hypothetical protein